MKSRRKKITIRIENYRRTVRRSGGGDVERSARCEICAADTLLIFPREAAAGLGTTVREIFRLVEAGSFHFTEVENGELLLCRRSVEEFRCENGGRDL